jgi:hypothetical protein
VDFEFKPHPSIDKSSRPYDALILWRMFVLTDARMRFVNMIGREV